MFKNHYNSKPTHGEENTLPSMTIPDQTMSIQTILHRYASGLPVGGEKIPVYNGEEFTPDIEHMDLADRQQYLEQVKYNIKQKQSELTAHQEALKASKTKKQQDVPKTSEEGENPPLNQ